jgi:Tfp pilus assembly protein PilN
MATILMPPEPAAPAEQAPRMLTIAVNLLPPEIVGSRRGRQARRRVISALAAFTVLLGAGFGAASYQTSLARSELSSAQSDVERLSRQQKPFGELIGAQNESRAIGTQLSVLLAGDLQWSNLLSSVQAATPQGVQLTELSGALTPANGAGAGNGSASSRLPGTSAEKLIGTLTITGTSTGKPAVAAYLDTLATLPGLANPLLVSAAPQNGVFTFVARLDVTGSALGGRFTATNGNGSTGR